MILERQIKMRKAIHFIMKKINIVIGYRIWDINNVPECN